MNREVYASKESDNWATPSFIYSQVIAKGYFDPCPLHSKFNGLIIPWRRKTYVNPPYSRLREWIKKAIQESRNGCHVILLIPARTDTKAFKEIYEYGANIKFIIGRLRFNEAKPAPFPSMLVTLTGQNSKCEIIEREDINL